MMALCKSFAAEHYAEAASDKCGGSLRLQGPGLKKADKKAEASSRRPRADAIRNRERVMEAAKAAFTKHGPEASLEEIARNAEVGIGTLYRNFPTREALLEAVYRREVERLAEAAERLLKAHPPIEALRAWFLLFADYMTTKKVVLPALAGNPNVSESSAALIRAAMNDLLMRGIAAGEIRKDIQTDDLIQVLAGLAYSVSTPGPKGSSGRFIDVVIAGLRVE